MSIATEISSRAFGAQTTGQDIVLDVDSYSVDVLGGPKDATIQAIGSEAGVSVITEWLRCPVLIKVDEDQVWWGFVASVELTVGAWAIGSSIDTMINRLNIIHNTPMLYGTADQQETGWDQNDDGVVEYGIKEKIITMADVPTSQALAEQARILNERRYPLGTLDLADGGIQATLHCRGWMETLKWRYFSQPAGYIGHTTGSKTQKLGVGLSGTGIGFSAEKRIIHDLAARLGSFDKDDRIVVSGAGSNNGIYTVEQSTAKTAVSYTATTLSWGTESGPHWKLYDIVGHGLGAYDAGDMIFVSGGVNTGWYRVLAGAGDGEWIEVDRTVTTAAAGASITVQRGNSIVVVETLIDAYPSGTSTIAIYGEALRQSFLVSTGGWTVGALGIRARKVGTPVDGLRLALYSNSAGNPNTLLDSLVVAAADCPTAIDWITATIANTVSTANATTYHVVVDRTGSNHDANYYEIAVDEDLGYLDGSMALKDGGAWNTSYTRTPDADMLFRVVGHKELTAQIRDIITSCGQFFAGVDIQATSGVVSPQYRDGKSTAYDELLALLDATTTGRRLIATVTPERYLRITEEPEPPSTTAPAPYALDRDGRLRDSLNRRILATKPVWGVWVDVAVWGDLGIRAKLASVASLFIEGMDIDPKSGKQRPRARGTESRFALGGIRNG